MNAPPPPVQQQQPSVPSATAQVASGVGAVWGILMILPIVFLFVFHLGAGYLSYQKYGNIGWALLNFFFAYFYYPYYAFFLASAPAETPMMAPALGTSLVGGLRKLFKGRKH